MTDTEASDRGKAGPGRSLYRAAQCGDLVSMATALAQGAEVNWSHPEEEGRTALIGAARGVSVTSTDLSGSLKITMTHFNAIFVFTHVFSSISRLLRALL